MVLSNILARPRNVSSRRSASPDAILMCVCVWPGMALMATGMEEDRNLVALAEAGY